MWLCDQFLRCVQERRAMRGEDSGGTHGEGNMLQKNILGQPWMEYRGKQGGGDGTIVTHSRDKG